MTRIKKLAAAFAVGLALTGFAGCNSSGSLDSSQKLVPAESKTQTQGAPAIDVPSPAEPAADVNCMPIVNIQTKDDGPNAMDFVTKPVKRLVSEKIATWTPNYVMPPEPYYTDCSVSLTDVDDKLLIDAADAWTLLSASPG